MRELRISFFLLFLLFVCVDVTTTVHSLGIRKILFEEIDYRLSEASLEIEKGIGKISGNIRLEEVYPLLIRYSLAWVEFFDSKGHLIRSTSMEADLMPEEFSNTPKFWGYRYGLFSIKNGYLLISTSEEYLKAFRKLFRISIILRFLLYSVFMGFGVYLFRVFSYPFKTVEEVTGRDKKEIEFTMATIKEMAKDYSEKLKNLQQREKSSNRDYFSRG